MSADECFFDRKVMSSASSASVLLLLMQEENKKLFLRRGDSHAAWIVSRAITTWPGDLMSDEVWGDEFRWDPTTTTAIF